MTAGVLGAAIVAALVVNFAPAIVDRLREGSNPAIERFAFETEVFSLRALQLVLPVRDHRIERLADVRERYERQVGVTEASFAALGIVGTVGLVVLLATPARDGRSPGRRPARRPAARVRGGRSPGRVPLRDRRAGWPRSSAT